MAEYIVRCSLEANGSVFDNFTDFTETSTTVSKQVNLMNTTGTAKMLPRYGFSVEAVIPKAASGVNLQGLYRGTFTVEYENGDRVSFGGVSISELGDKSTNGEDETTQSLTFIAESRTPDLSL